MPDAFQNVLDTILQVFEALKAFFAKLTDMFAKEEENAEG